MLFTNHFNVLALTFGSKAQLRSKVSQTKVKHSRATRNIDYKAMAAILSAALSPDASDVHVGAETPKLPSAFHQLEAVILQVGQRTCWILSQRCGLLKRERLKSCSRSRKRI